jgi:hypothetical protein
VGPGIGGARVNDYGVGLIGQTRVKRGVGKAIAEYAAGRKNRYPLFMVHGFANPIQYAAKTQEQPSSNSKFEQQ